MAYQSICKENGLLRFAYSGYVVTFSKPSSNTASVSIEVGHFDISLSQIIASCTVRQISFHCDELSNSNFMQFGFGTTLTKFDWFQCQLICDYFGLPNHLTMLEAM